jgi:hypothetical protein
MGLGVADLHHHHLAAVLAVLALEGSRWVALADRGQAAEL